jgi:hypothetical protein
MVVTESYMKLAGNVARKRKTRNASKILAEYFEAKANICSNYA